MDLNSLLQTMLSADSVGQMSKKTGASTDAVTSVLMSALPAMLSGVQGQASNRDTVAGFAGALDSHAADDVSDIAAFFSKVDVQDGNKIMEHLLGGQKGTTTKAAAQQAGISTDATSNVLGMAAPLLMSLLGQQATRTAKTQYQPAQPSGAGLLSALLGGAAQQQQAPAQPGIGDLIGGLLGGSQQKSAKNNLIGDMISGMLGGDDVASVLAAFLGSEKK